ncbi:2Fe-2S iron-sulfur cluster-binding protein [Bacillus piscicola]|uniref:2Fe-2S iron-sulfur cluster-binding protein n=1 Tax=Bacillus piscicola TaxID=1632684 RepID=UPI001F08EFF6|nr:2Fe-2S iron-sulfur cluster-binding protein [Bacillus piscicola]
MAFLTLSIKRKTDHLNEQVAYQVDARDGETTLLNALQKIQTEQDPTLAIRYGCRFKDCGLCAVKVNGKEKMACLTKVKNDMLVEPLDNVPVVQDLVVERSYITDTIIEKGLIPDTKSGETTHVSEEYKAVNKCTDCQVCLSASTLYSHENRDAIAGPMFFVKLAQIYYHPQLSTNYEQKIKDLGINHYKNSEVIPCPYGVPINKLAIAPFLTEE